MSRLRACASCFSVLASLMTVPTALGASVSAAALRDPLAIAVGGAHVWVTSGVNASITEIAAASGKILRVLDGEPASRNPSTAIAASGNTVWVTNPGDDSVTEINALNGVVLRVINGKNGGFNHPNGIAANASRVWISNANSVSVLNASNGALVKVIKARRDRLSGADGIAIDNSNVWVLNPNFNSVTELDESTGHLVRVISSRVDKFDGPSSIAFGRGHVWVTSNFGRAVTELNESTGTVVRVLTFPDTTGYESPNRIVAEGVNVWVTSLNSVFELSASSGAIIRVFHANVGHFAAPFDMTLSGYHLWVTNSAGNSVSEVNAVNGSLIHLIR